LKDELIFKDIKVLLSILEPLPTLPVQYPGELVSLQKSVLDICEQLMNQDMNSSVIVIPLILKFISLGIGYPYQVSNSSSWNPTEESIDKKYKALSLKATESLLKIIQIVPSDRINDIFEDIIKVIGRIIQIKNVKYDYQIWVVGVDIFVTTIQRGISSLSKKEIEKANEIWIDMLDSIEAFLIATPISEDKISNDSELDIKMCSVVSSLICESFFIPSVQPRISHLIKEIMNVEGKVIKRSMYSQFFLVLSDNENIDEEIKKKSSQFVYPLLVDFCRETLQMFSDLERSESSPSEELINDVIFILSELKNLRMRENVIENQRGKTHILLDLFTTLSNCIITNNKKVKELLIEIFNIVYSTNLK